MSNIISISLLLVIGLIFLLMSGMWVGIALALIGYFGLTFVVGGGMEGMLGVIQFNTLNSFELSAIPLFIFLGNVMLYGGMMEKIYQGINPLLSRLPGGLLHSNIGACAIFGACSGSSIAGAAAIGKSIMPYMKKLGYDKYHIYGSIGGGGTLASMIPPSIAFILYGSWVGESVGKLFIAGVLPGLLLAFIFMLYISISTILKPSIQPYTEKIPFTKAIISLINIIPVAAVIFSVLGTIYLGIATPTESAALGVSASLIYCLITKKLSFSILKEILLDTVKTSSMIFFILIGAMAFSMVISMLRIPEALSIWVVSLGWGRWSVFLVVVIIYIILGALIDPTSMMLMTIPITYPLMMKLGFDSIWFGVCMAVFVQMAVLTPPLGLNLYVLQGISKEKDLMPIIRGCTPYFACTIILIVLLYIFPDIATWLPELVMGR